MLIRLLAVGFLWETKRLKHNIHLIETVIQTPPLNESAAASGRSVTDGEVGVRPVRLCCFGFTVMACSAVVFDG